MFKKWSTAIHNGLRKHSFQSSLCLCFAIVATIRFLERALAMGRLFNISLAIFAATGSFLFGYDSGVMTDVIQSPHFLSFFNTDKTSPIIGAINSTFSGGAVFGSLM